MSIELIEKISEIRRQYILKEDNKELFTCIDMLGNDDPSIKNLGRVILHKFLSNSKLERVISLSYNFIHNDSVYINGNVFYIGIALRESIAPYTNNDTNLLNREEAEKSRLIREINYALKK